jgi:hypothetical protein
MNGVVMCLARLHAKDIVKQDWRDQGRKLSEIDARDLVSFANAYLAGNPELIDQAAEIVRTDPRFRIIAERHERTMRRLLQRRCQA